MVGLHSVNVTDSVRDISANETANDGFDTDNYTNRVAWGKKNLGDYLSSRNHVTLYVGPSARPFVLNEELLCDRIDYFRVEFSLYYPSGQEKAMELPNDDPEVFNKLVDWLYGVPVICNKTNMWGNDDGSVHSAFGKEHEIFWCKLFVMANKFGVDELEIEALQLLESCTRNVSIRQNTPHMIARETIDYVYQNTLAPSQLRTAIIEEVVTYYFHDLEDISKFKELVAGKEQLQMDVIEAISERILDERRESARLCRQYNALSTGYIGHQKTPNPQARGNGW